MLLSETFPFLIGKVLTKERSKDSVNNGGGFPFLIGKVLTYEV